MILHFITKFLIQVKAAIQNKTNNITARFLLPSRSTDYRLLNYSREREALELYCLYGGNVQNIIAFGLNNFLIHAKSLSKVYFKLADSLNNNQHLSDLYHSESIKLAFICKCIRNLQMKSIFTLISKEDIIDIFDNYSFLVIEILKTERMLLEQKQLTQYKISTNIIDNTIYTKEISNDIAIVDYQSIQSFDHNNNFLSMKENDIVNKRKFIIKTFFLKIDTAIKKYNIGIPITAFNFLEKQIINNDFSLTSPFNDSLYDLSVFKEFLTETKDGKKLTFPLELLDEDDTRKISLSCIWSISILETINDNFSQVYSFDFLKSEDKKIKKNHFNKNRNFLEVQEQFLKYKTGSNLSSKSILIEVISHLASNLKLFNALCESNLIKSNLNLDKNNISILDIFKDIDQKKQLQLLQVENLKEEFMLFYLTFSISKCLIFQNLIFIFNNEVDRLISLINGDFIDFFLLQNQIEVVQTSSFGLMILIQNLVICKALNYNQDLLDKLYSITRNLNGLNLFLDDFITEIIKSKLNLSDNIILTSSAKSIREYIGVLLIRIKFNLRHFSLIDNRYKNISALEINITEIYRISNMDLDSILDTLKNKADLQQMISIFNQKYFKEVDDLSVDTHLLDEFFINTMEKIEFWSKSDFIFVGLFLGEYIKIMHGLRFDIEQEYRTDKPFISNLFINTERGQEIFLTHLKEFFGEEIIVKFIEKY